MGLVPLVIIVLFRYGVGADYFSYKYIYTDNIGKSILQAKASFPNIDYGYLTLSFLFQSLGINFELFFSILSLVVLVLMALWIKDASDNPSLALLVYYTMFFFVWNLSAIRQGLVLSTSLYLVFNPKINFKMSVKVVILLLLATVHFSALLLLLFLLVRKTHFTKKQHLIILCFGLLVTYLPITLILEHLTFIPGVTRFLEYSTNGSGFFNFSDISRLVLYFLVFLNYDRISEKNETREIIDVYLIGLSIYFMMSFSQVAAGRFGIYSLIYLVILLPEIVISYTNDHTLKNLSKLGLICLCVSFFIKEMNTLVEQTGIVFDTRYIPFTTIFNKSDFEYDDYHYVYTKRNDIALNQYDQFMKSFRESSSVIATQEDSYMAAYDPVLKQYIIINNKGERVSDWSFINEPKVVKHYVKYHIFEGDSRTTFYVDLTAPDTELSEYTMRSIDYATRTDKVATNVSNYKIEDLSNLHKEKLLNVNKASNIQISSYDKPDFYYVVTMDYYYSKIQFILDKNKNPLIEDYYYSSSRFDSNNFFQLETSRTIEFFYIDGTRVWMVKK